MCKADVRRCCVCACADDDDDDEEGTTTNGRLCAACDGEETRVCFCAASSCSCFVAAYDAVVTDGSTSCIAGVSGMGDMDELDDALE